MGAVETVEQGKGDGECGRKRAYLGKGHCSGWEVKLGEDVPRFEEQQLEGRT